MKEIKNTSKQGRTKNTGGFKPSVFFCFHILLLAKMYVVIERR